MDWDKLRIFYTVAQAGSFTKACDKLGVSQSALSRQISALEAELQVRLFSRHSRGLVLNEQGEILYQTAHEIMNRLSWAENAILETKERPKGPLRITTTIDLSATWLTARLKEFMDLYPEIEVTLLTNEQQLDLNMREADVAIRFGSSTQPDLIQRHLMTVNSGIFAHNQYLKEHGEPATVEELEQHRIIAYSDDPQDNENWLLWAGRRGNRPRKAHFIVNSQTGILRAVKSGIGIAALPIYMVKRNSQNLTRILKDVHGPAMDAYLVYPNELRKSKRVRVFRDFIIRKVSESRF